MTRIVAGQAGGRTIDVPPRGTRPTSDRVREAIFSRLDALGVVEGARVLDLFCGSGALGLEAASRGAASVTLVDSSKQACAVVRRNVASLGLSGCTVVMESAARFAARADGQAPFDLVFLDPPYDQPDAALTEVLANLAYTNKVTPTTVVVVERSTRTPSPTLPPGWAVEATKTYGDTAIYYEGASE